MRRWFCFLVLALEALLSGQDDADPSAFVERTLPSAPGAFLVSRYRLLRPATVEVGRRYPLVVFLHGAGERGDDNRSQLRHMPERMLTAANRERFPCFVLAVQCPERRRWVEVDWSERRSQPTPERPSPALLAVLAALEETLRTEPIDRDRLYLTGLSMGGYGAWDLAVRYPHWWAAVAPVCGGGDERFAARLRQVPVFAVHDAGDPVVPVERSRSMIEAITAAGGQPRYLETTGLGHPSWTRAYGDDGVLGWMFEQRRRLPSGPWLPWPRQVTFADGRWTPGPQARIVAGSPELVPLAAILRDEAKRTTGRAFALGEQPQAGDLVLAFDSTLADGHYRLTIDDGAVVLGRDHDAVALGSVTLLQALAADQGLPRCTIDDAGDASWRGVMIDCARHPQSVATLEAVIELCRFYKLRQLHLHLTDNEAFTFPSRAFPKVATPGRAYSRAELEGLERFARARGVVLVPELDVPGHSTALIAAEPEVFGLRDRSVNGGLVHMGREATYAALDRLVGEMCEVFASSPWFHIGGDEAWLAAIDQDPEARAYLQAHDLPNVQELYRHFLVRMDAIVRKHGKRTLVWEGFHRDGAVAIPDDIIVLGWEAAYQHPRDLLAAGRTVINASWQPLYVVGGGKLPPHAAPRRWSQEHLYRWNARRWEHFAPQFPTFEGFQAAPGDAVLGAQICVWEQLEHSVLETLRPRVAAVAERLWNADAGRSFADFEERHARSDATLLRLLGPASSEAPREPEAEARVRYTLYRAPRRGWTAIPDFTSLPVEARGTLPGLRGGLTAGPLGMVLESRLEVPIAGDYELTLHSCDGIAELWIDGARVAAHLKVGDWNGETVTVPLAAGTHDLQIRYAQGFFNTLCRVFYKAPGMAEPKLIDELLRLPR